MFPLQFTPLHDPYTALCKFSTHESNAAIHFLKHCSRVASLLPSPLLRTWTGFQIWWVRWIFHHWDLVFHEKHLHREGIVCWCDILYVLICFSSERLARAWIVFNVFPSLFKSLKPLKNLSMRWPLITINFCQEAVSLCGRFSKFSEEFHRAHSPTFPSLHLRHNSFSNSSVILPTSQLSLEPFHCFTYITVHSPTLLSLLLCHKLFT